MRGIYSCDANSVLSLDSAFVLYGVIRNTVIIEDRYYYYVLFYYSNNNLILHYVGGII